MKSKVTYEWCSASVDEHGDMDDLVHSDTLKDLLIPDGRHSIELVRNLGNDADGLIDRCWAPLEAGRLPDAFTYYPGDGPNVPKRFHEEVRRFFESKT
jgi:hypothetical protein